MEYSQNNFEQIYSEHQNQVRRFCMTRLFARHWDSLDDIVQDTFLSCYLNIHKYDERAKFTTWLFEIAKNKCVDFVRYTNALKRSPIVVGVGDWCTHYYQPDIIAIDSEIDKILSPLAEKEKRVLHLKFYQGMNSKQIAKSMGINSANVRQILHRSIYKIRQLRRPDDIF